MGEETNKCENYILWYLVWGEGKKHHLRYNSQGRPLGKSENELRSEGLKGASHMKSQGRISEGNQYPGPW